jgi:hypothetical protein
VGKTEVYHVTVVYYGTEAVVSTDVYNNNKLFIWKRDLLKRVKTSWGSLKKSQKVLLSSHVWIVYKLSLLLLSVGQRVKTHRITLKGLTTNAGQTSVCVAHSC